MDQPDLTETERLGRLYRRSVSRRGDVPGGACVSPEALVGLIRREGSEAERLATLEHVMSCAACHREYEWLSAVDQAATEAGREAGRPAWWRRAPLALAASLVAALGVGLLVQSQLRSGTETVRGEDGDIALVAPAPTAPADESLDFVWHPLPDASGYVLEVQRHDGSIVFSDTTSDTVVTLGQPGRVLTAPEHRWWVRELTDGAEPRSSGFRPLRLSNR